MSVGAGRGRRRRARRARRRLRRRAALPRGAVTSGAPSARSSLSRSARRSTSCSSTRRRSRGPASRRRRPPGCARSDEQEFIAFSVNCAHLGCPVRWLATRASSCAPATAASTTRTVASPPDRRRTRLTQYPVRVRDGEVEISHRTDPDRLTHDQATPEQRLGDRRRPPRHHVAASARSWRTRCRAARAGGTSSAARRCSRSSSRC